MTPSLRQTIAYSRSVRTTPYSSALLLALAFSLLATPVARADERIEPDGIRGTLFVCGGGSLADDVLERFVTIAGGADGKLVVIPTASERADEPNASTEAIDRWTARGLASVSVLHTRSRQRAGASDFVATLRDATAVWISGGDQSRLSEAYVDTAVERELIALLARGGVVGGTSAGAAIASRVMIAGGNPVARVGRGLERAK